MKKYLQVYPILLSELFPFYFYKIDNDKQVNTL
ncbi:Hypothetical protein Minf_1809 [Methylacidiphilum infernorum V4]|uniref:Uncharacterized protein n=1 Tax=Methylacidiphilum infernorum (isolate V4) TaxID=481448 RepID=B3DXF4_METI4|nr:Hypothetical protein Minf_1809 [Methylacidiphilum infernorum V4]